MTGPTCGPSQERKPTKDTAWMTRSQGQGNPETWIEANMTRKIKSTDILLYS